MSSPLDSLIARYNPTTAQEFENALKEIIQEITLAGLARSHFFDKAAFYGGTALRIFFGLPRFSEDLDFTLLEVQPDFSLRSYFNSVKDTLSSFGLDVEVEKAEKKVSTDVESAFLKANTKIHFLKIDAGKKFANKIQDNKKIMIKFEVDTTPPLGFETEIKVLPPPITSSIKVLKLSHLFAGKMHAVLFRQWKSRVKGRDFYDLLWYLGQQAPLNLNYLENKMRDGGKWTESRKMEKQDLMDILNQRIQSIDFASAKLDVANFLRDQKEISDWNQELFLSAVQNLRVDTGS